MSEFVNQNTPDKDPWSISITIKPPVVLEGDYGFTVKSYRREMYPGDKYGNPAGPRAVFTLLVATDQGPVTVTSAAYVMENRTQKLESLYISVGLFKPGDTFNVNLEKLVGKRGVGEFHHKVNGNDESNYLWRFKPYDPARFEQFFPPDPPTFTQVPPPDDCPW